MQLDAPLCLASASPRRRAFLAGAGVPLVVAPVNLDETPRPHEDPADYVQRMAAEKAAAADSGRWTLTSDTVVVHRERILGKPTSEREAAEMLTALAGDAHEVLTAWVLRGPGGARCGMSRTAVVFRPLEPQEIAAYVASGEPFDKAGGYGIQGPAGDFVEATEGDYDAVVGLPLGPVLDALQAAGVVRFDSAIEANAALVKGRIAAALDGAGRPADDVTLVAVSKGHPASVAQAAYDAGLVDLGENYAQALRDKAAAIPAPIRWHFIGRLQRNKAKYVAPVAACVHGLDDARAAEALGRRAVDAGRELPCLVQVDLAGEASKGGVPPAGAEALLDVLSATPGLRPRGLMTVPPAGSRLAARRWFAQLRDLRDRLAHAERPLPALSMGMSGDFEQAIAMGATLVRVGTAIFGRRTG